MSKRPVASPVASPSKAASNAKRSRTHYDYYDEEDVESHSEEQWRDGSMDSPSRMSLDGSDDFVERFMPGPVGDDTLLASVSSDDEFVRPKYDRDREVTEVGH